MNSTLSQEPTLSREGVIEILGADLRGVVADIDHAHFNFGEHWRLGAKSAVVYTADAVAILAEKLREAGHAGPALALMEGFREHVRRSAPRAQEPVTAASSDESEPWYRRD